MLISINVLSLQSPDLYPVAFSNGLSIKGQINEMGRNLPCRVELYHQASKRIVSSVATDQAGNYQFSNLLKTSFFIVAHHPSSQDNAVIQDKVVPK